MQDSEISDIIAWEETFRVTGFCMWASGSYNSRDFFFIYLFQGS
jgi:hypothetical protein